MTTQSRTMLVIAALIAGGSAGACNKQPEEARQEGIEAQQHADEKIGEAQAEAHEKAIEARRDQAAATDEARRNAAEAQANANEKIRDANRAASADTDARKWAQAKIDDVDNMIDAASAKAQAAAPKNKAQFTTRLEQVKQERDVLRTEVAKLETSSGDRLDRAKEQFDDRIDRIKSNIRSLEKSL